jgi:nucleoside phosphorylase
VESARLIATALPEELGALLRRAPGGRRVDGAWESSLGGRPVRLACTGSGPRPAARGLDALLEKRPASLVIGAGVAGALTPQLDPGDVVVGRWVRDRDGDAPPSDECWRGRALQLGARPVVAFTVDRVLTQPAERAALAHALPEGVAGSVDMESAAWSRAAERRGSACLIVRAISDAASVALPEYLSDCLDARGGISRARVGVRALLCPASLPSLLRLRRQVREAAERLAQFLEDLFRLEA